MKYKHFENCTNEYKQFKYHLKHSGLTINELAKKLEDPRSNVSEELPDLFESYTILVNAFTKLTGLFISLRSIHDETFWSFNGLIPV